MAQTSKVLKNLGGLYTTMSFQSKSISERYIVFVRKRIVQDHIGGNKEVVLFITPLVRISHQSRRELSEKKIYRIAVGYCSVTGVFIFLTTKKRTKKVAG